MDKIKIVPSVTMKVDEVNYLKHRTVCETWYNKNRRKNTSHHNQKSKLLITIKKNNRTSTIIRRNTRTVRSHKV